MIRFELTANEGINHFVAGSLLEEFVQLLSVKPNEIRNLQEISKGQIVTIDGKDSILKLVMQVYSEVLPRKWQIHDNFFNVGGHSLVATLAVGKFKNQYETFA
ncbi:Uncharacterised protein [Oligella ureolytica]|uniref:hypothetical protein n=1 Tax=Oligella ureolytica TaxID=90244 RepID=UPI000E046435|nr:hypothetical protein [Oligella ureolytica]SUA54210.1 Uncharacterised protein [Oligella ureolytica]